VFASALERSGHRCAGQAKHHAAQDVLAILSLQKACVASQLAADDRPGDGGRMPLQELAELAARLFGIRRAQKGKEQGIGRSGLPRRLGRASERDDLARRNGHGESKKNSIAWS
jgi:hypothetical protein